MPLRINPGVPLIRGEGPFVWAPTAATKMHYFPEAFLMKIGASCSSGTAVLLLYYSSTTVVLQQYYSLALVLQWCYSSTTVLLEYYNSITLVLQ